MAILSVRIDSKTASAIDRVVARTGKSKSEVVREGIAAYAEKIDQQTKPARPYEKMAPYLGMWDSGGMQFSTDTGRKYSEMLIRERNERRRADRRRTSHRTVR